MPKFIILGHKNPDFDSIASGYIYKNYLQRRNIDVEFIIPDKKIDKDTLDLCNLFSLDPKEYQKPLEYDDKTKFILVDHHTRKDIKNVALIIDSNLDGEQPNTDNAVIEPASSTAHLIVKDYEAYYSSLEVELAVVASLIECDLSKKEEAKSLDIDWIRTLDENRKIDYNEIIDKLKEFKQQKRQRKTIFNEHQNHNIEGYKVESSSIYTDDLRKEWKNINEIVENLQSYVKGANIDYYLFTIYDTNNLDTWIYTITKEGYTREKYDEQKHINEIVTEFKDSLSLNQKQKVKTDN